MMILLIFYFNFYFFWVIKGDYGISRKEAVLMTSGAGTEFVTGNE
jgi:hypothetical protein